MCTVIQNLIYFSEQKMSNISTICDTNLVEDDFSKIFPEYLKFENVTYTTTRWTKLRRERKEILHGISGKFRCGKLSVIMGPSGAGKTTLLNILSGFITVGSEGKIYVNNTERSQDKKIQLLSGYISHDQELRSNLTAIEAITVAADLKLGRVSPENKTQKILDLLETLGLDKCKNVMTANLSGGERKRLTLALELINDPKILFLDEPTTGLDSLSCSQCISLLKCLAQEGRIIICTVHQPTALHFEKFDHLYAIAEGRCIYQGPTANLLPHLATFNLHCPVYHNPADFLLEVAVGNYDTDVKMLADLITKSEDDQDENDDIQERQTLNGSLHAASDNASMFMQFVILYKRNFLMSKRNYMYFINRLLAHIVIAIIFGYIYWDVGTGAHTIFANYGYVFGTVLLLSYTGTMAVALNFPLNMKALQAEHFNRWYRLTPYFLSEILFETPIQLICCYLYILISYWFTGQPFNFRMGFYFMFCSICTICAQAWGYFIGTTVPLVLVAFLAPSVIATFAVFGFNIFYYDIPVLFRWMYHISYLRAGMHSLMNTLYGFDRNDLVCPEEKVYCPFKDASLYLKKSDMADVNLTVNASIIISMGCGMYLLSFFALWWKLNKR